MRDVLRDFGLFLTFRGGSAIYERLDGRHFLLGLPTWVVGIGRNWDFPEAPLFARLGLGSVLYVFCLALVFTLFAWPVSPKRLRYRQVVTVTVLTAAPGLVYAIPVEAFLAPETAQQTNLGFLAIVATWRVALMVHFLAKGCGNSASRTFAIFILPISLLILALGGHRPGGLRDGSYGRQQPVGFGGRASG